MSTWWGDIRRFLGDDVFEGLSFFVALLTLTVPFALKRLNFNNKARLAELFWWLALPSLVVCTVLSAYGQHYELGCVLGGALIVLYLVRQREVSKLVVALENAQNELEDRQRRLRLLEGRLEKFFDSGPRWDPDSIIRP